MTSGLLLVDKAAGMTSHDVVAIARRALQTRGVGHAGTLDPMATGLLVLAVGEGRKVLRYLVLDDKRYLATVRLGVGTVSLDADGEVNERAPVPTDVDRARVEAALGAFVGEYEQQAPAVSAIKRGGVALYERVRRGEAVEAPVRRVRVHSIRLSALRDDPPELDLEVHCGSGFYVRSLARDLALALGTVGHLSALRRTSSGHFSVVDAVSTELLRAARDDDAARATLGHRAVGLLAALPDVPRLMLGPEGLEDARHGRRIALEHVLGASRVAAGAEPLLLLDASGAVVAFAREQDGVLRVVRGINGPLAER